MSDEQELARLQLQDLFLDAANGLFAKALTATGGKRGPAEELVQEVFHAAWEAWGEIGKRDLSGQRAWLYVTLNHKVIDAFRRKQREVPTETPELELDLLRREKRTPLGPAPSPAPSAMWGAILDQCWNVIKKMPPVRRKVLYLRAHEWKTAEIADFLQIKPTTVRDHYSKGLQQLNEEIGPAHEIFDGLMDPMEDEFEDKAE